MARSDSRSRFTISLAHGHCPSRRGSCRFFRRGFTIIELFIGSAIVLTLLMIFQRLGVGEKQKILTGKLTLQMDALKAANNVMRELRRCSEFVRPHQGETTPYMVARDMTNQMLFLYLDKDPENTSLFKKELYKLVQYRDTYSGAFQAGNQRVLIPAVQKLTFTSLDANTVQMNLTVANERDDFQFVTSVSAMNLGDLE